jgi:hypothetical protein
MSETQVSDCTSSTVVLIKNWKIYWSEQNLTDLGPEDQCSSCGLYYCSFSALKDYINVKLTLIRSIKLASNNFCWQQIPRKSSVVTISLANVMWLFWRTMRCAESIFVNIHLVIFYTKLHKFERKSIV